MSQMLLHSNNPRSSAYRHSSASQSTNSLNYKERKLSKASKLRSQFMKQLILLSIIIEGEREKLSTLREELVTYSQLQQRGADKGGKKSKDKKTKSLNTSNKKGEIGEKGKQRQESRDADDTIHDGDERNDGGDKGLKAFLAMKSRIYEQERKIARLVKDVDLVRLRQKEAFKVIWEDRGMDWGKLGED